MSCGRKCSDGTKCKRHTGGSPCHQHQTSGRQSSKKSPKKSSPRSPRSRGSPGSPGSPGSFLDLSPKMAPSVYPELLLGTTPPKASSDPRRIPLPLTPIDEWLASQRSLYSSSSSEWSSEDYPPYELGYGNIVTRESPLPKKRQ